MPPPVGEPEEMLVAAQLSALYPSSQISTIPVQTSRQTAPLPPPLNPNDPPVEHATYATALHVPTMGTLVLRVLHQGLILELLSLSTDVNPIRFVLPSPVVPCPAMFLWQGVEIHIIAVTMIGSIHRLVLPVGEGKLLHEPRPPNWSREYLIENITEPVDGLVHVHGTHCVAIGQRNGSLLRIETDVLGNESRNDVWTEAPFQHTSFLRAITSFLPALHTGPRNAAEIISMATHPQPTDIGYIWTLSRDRTVRLWTPNGGCVSSKVLAYSFGRETTPVSLSSPNGSQPQMLLEGERQTLLRAFSPNSAGEQLYLLAFVPTPSSTTAGGFFQLLKTEDDQLHEMGRIDCSVFSAHRSLQDFIIVAGTLYALWDRQGQSAVEKTAVNPEEFNWSDIGYAWHLASYPEEPELTPAYLDELLLWPDSLANRYYEAIMRPGMFSTFTLRTALNQYIEAYLYLPILHPRLKMTYPSLGENIMAIIGCSINLQRDPKTGAIQYEQYWNALKRDWEGFIARCREIERSARWPLGLAFEETKGVALVIERERVGCLVPEDAPSRLRRRLGVGVVVNTDPYTLIEILWALRLRLGYQVMRLVESYVLDLFHQEFDYALSDLIADAANRLDIREHLGQHWEDWIGSRLQGIESLSESARDVVNMLGAFDIVKEEANDDASLDLSAPPTPPPHSEWSKTLITAYIATTVNARYDLSLVLIALFLFLPGYDWPPQLLEEALAIFRAIAMIRFVVRQPANGCPRSATGDAADHLVARLGEMRVTSPSRAHFAPSHSVIHELLSSCAHIPNIAQAAMRWLDECGLLESVSPSNVTPYEVAFCHSVANTGYTEVARQLLAWLPRTVGVSYLQAQLLLRAGRGDDAAYLLQKLAARFGPDGALSREDKVALKKLANFNSAFAFYKYAAFEIFDKPWIHYKVAFAQLAISVAPPNENTTDLWDAVIEGNIALAQYEDAYAAIIAATPEPIKGERVSHLVYKMCEDDVVEKLMSFNFAGLSEDVRHALAYKARIMDPRSRPYYARILYSWYISRGDYRNAAMTMYQRGRKLQTFLIDASTVMSLAEEQIEAYLMAINSLALVDRKNAWFALPVSEDMAHEPRKRRKLSQHIPENDYYRHREDPEIIYLDDIRYEYTLLSARLELARGDSASLLPELFVPPDLIVLRLVQANRFDYAMATARMLNVDMSDLFCHLTRQCLTLSRNPKKVLQEDTSDWLLTDKVSSWPGKPSDRGWRYLRQALERNDNAESDYKYSKVTLETILTFDPMWPVPPWLIQTLEKHHHEYLIRISLQYENLQAALEHTISLIRKADDQLAREVSKSASSTWLPYTLIDQVVAASNQDDLPPATKALREELQKILKSRVKRIERLSEISR